MTDAKTANELSIELEAILSKLDNLARMVGAELDKPVKKNDGMIKMKIGEITGLTHQFMQFLPRMAAIRAVCEKQGPEQAHAWAQLSIRMGKARTWINDWHKVENLIRQQVPARRNKLFRRSNHTEDARVSQLHLYDDIFNDLHNMLGRNSQDDASKDHGCFADISLPHSLFIEHVHAAHRVLLAKGLDHPTRFLDVGCGGGLKVLSAAKFFDQAEGLEFDPGYVASAQSLFDKAATDRCRVIQADGLTYKDYSQHDVIYFYRPMRDEKRLRQLERQIVTTARPGTLIIAPYQMFDHQFEALGCAHLANRLYITQTLQSDANKLRRLAEMTGVAVVRKQNTVATVWDPILTPSAARGFAFTNHIEGYWAVA